MIVVQRTAAGSEYRATKTRPKYQNAPSQPEEEYMKNNDEMKNGPHSNGRGGGGGVLIETQGGKGNRETGKFGG